MLIKTEPSLGILEPVESRTIGIRVPAQAGRGDPNIEGNGQCLGCQIVRAAFGCFHQLEVIANLGTVGTTQIPKEVGKSACEPVGQSGPVSLQERLAVLAMPEADR